ncbi:MAG: hypothetical protein OHK0046_28330 [Anaerolineae bacterium]
MALRRGFILVLPFLLIALTGCFRQASAPVGTLEQATSAPSVNNTTPPDLPTSDANAPLDPTPTIGIAVTQSTPIQAASDTPELPTAELATEVPVELPTDAPTEEPALVEPTLTQALVEPSATTQSGGGAVAPIPTDPGISTPQLILTPGAPGSGSAISTPTPEPSNEPTPTLPPSPLPENCVYVVQPGDNLFRIAVNNDTTVDALRAANPTIPANNVIQPGDRLTLPGCDVSAAPPAPAGDEDDAPVTAPEGTTIHIVQPGDTLLVIARQYNTTITEIVAANNLSNPDRLSVGQELIIPVASN